MDGVGPSTACVVLIITRIKSQSPVEKSTYNLLSISSRKSDWTSPSNSCSGGGDGRLGATSIVETSSTIAEMTGVEESEEV